MSAPRSRVAVVKASPETVLADVERVATMGGLEAALEKGRPTILKDNISWHFPFPGANTTPWQLEGTILALRKKGFDDLVCVQNDTVVTDPFKGERLNRYRGVLRRHGVPVRYNCVPDDIPWVRYEPKGRTRVLHEIWPEGFSIPSIFPGSNVVHLPTMKTHVYTTTTGAMKNAFGGLLNTRRHYTHAVIHETLVDLLMVQKEIHTGLFAVTDGTVCGNGPGPRTMIPVEKDFLLASADQVAIDAVASKMMGFDPMSIPYIRLAHEAGLGVGRVEEIEVAGEDVSRENFRFHVGDNLASAVGDLCWFGPLRVFERLFFRTPLVYLFVFGSYFFHDFAWWPFHGRAVAKRFRETSRWGRLFDRYEE